MTELYGDGIHDDSSALQEMLNQKGNVIIPAGKYLIKSTLVIGSGTQLIADKDAHFLYCTKMRHNRGEFMIATEPLKRTRNIAIIGGTWDCSDGRGYIKKYDTDDSCGYSGALINLCNAEEVTIGDLTVANSTGYGIRVTKTTSFTFHNLVFANKKPQFDQHCIYIAGGVSDGIIDGVYAKGKINGYVVCLCSDDSKNRVENLDLYYGDIFNIRVKNIKADNCDGFVHFSSVDNAINNVTVSDVIGGFNGCAVMIDSSRYSKVPIISDKINIKGFGHLTNITLSNFDVTWTKPSLSKAMMMIESQIDELRIINFRFNKGDFEENRKKPTLRVTNVYKRVIHTPLGKKIVLSNKQVVFKYSGNIENAKFTGF